MTRSRTRLKASSAWVILATLLLLTGAASAGRKRIVVLEFEGDKAEKFHEDVVRVIKKSHTVVSTDKWNGAAEEMSAAKLTGPNVKKVAKKLKVDGVVTGTVEKRRDEYILRLKLRSGASGELVGTAVNIKTESAKLDSTAAKDLKDELIESIASLESNRDGGGGGDDEEDEEEKPKKGGFVKKGDEKGNDEEEKPKKGGFVKKGDDEEEKPKKGGFGKKPDEEEKPKKADKADKADKAKKPDDEEAAALKPKSDKPDDDKPKKADKAAKSDDDDEGAKPKKVARKDDDDDDGGGDDGDAGVSASMTLSGAAAYSPGERAVDAAVGMSFTARRMGFSYNPNEVTTRPAGYKQSVPVPGLYIDVTAYPLAFGHNRQDILRHLGVTLMFDRVLSINSENPNGGMKFKSSEQRFAIGATFRHPLGQGESAPVVGGALRYNKQSFTIAGDAAIPDVGYSMFDVTGFFAYPLGPKMLLNLSAGLLLPLDAGEITLRTQYGRAKITGFEGSAGLDYLLTKNIFARTELRIETLGYSFQDETMRSTGVGGARDTYFGGVVTAGYLY